MEEEEKSNGSVNNRDGLSAIVVGGSLGGLFVGNILKSLGWKVSIYEQSPNELKHRGGGIVLQPDVVELMRNVGIDLSTSELGVISRNRTIYAPDGSTKYDQYAPQMQTAWNFIFNKLRKNFGDEDYHQGTAFASVQKYGNDVVAEFDNGEKKQATILIGADGTLSTVRKIVEPEYKPDYAGYVAWRGLVPENEMPEAAKKLIGDFSFADDKGSQILGYLVPGKNNDLRPGQRDYNWVWYRPIDEVNELQDMMTNIKGKKYQYSIPPGQLTKKWHQRLLDDAEILLPPNFRALVRTTEQPFAQAILDSYSQRMVYGNILLMGDAAFTPRPHTAASTAKAAGDALALGQVLKESKNRKSLTRAFAIWEDNRLEAGRQLYKHGIRLGSSLMAG